MQLPGAMNSHNLLRRVKASLFMAALNLSAILWPHVPDPYYVIFLISALVVNVAVGLVVLRGVEPTRDADPDEMNTAFAKRWISWLGYSSACLFLILALMGWLDWQFIPFQICGYAFLMVTSQVLEISLYKGMDELRDHVDS